MSTNHMSPGERRLAGRIGAARLWAGVDDRAAHTAAARAAAEARFERQADPDGVLPPAVRRAKAQQLRAEFYARIQLRSAQSRSAARKTK